MKRRFWALVFAVLVVCVEPGVGDLKIIEKGPLAEGLPPHMRLFRDDPEEPAHPLIVLPDGRIIKGPVAVGMLPPSFADSYVPDVLWELQAENPNADIVLLASGDHISGSIGEISAEGVVVVKNPLFTGPAGVRLSGVRQIALKGGSGSFARADTLVLTGGNRISGEVLEISADTIVIKTEYMGEVKVPRNVVAWIGFKTADGKAVLETDFLEGKTGPWQPAGGRQWKGIKGEGCFPPGGRLVAELKQKGPLTFEWTVDGLRPDFGGGGLVAFAEAEGKSNFYGGNSIWIRPIDRYMYVCYVRNNTLNEVMCKRVLSRPLTSATYRASYDPATGCCLVSVNGVGVGTAVINPPIKTGNFVMLYAEGPCAYRSVRITPGAVASAEGIKGGKNNEQFVLANGDEITGTLESLKDGRAFIQTAHGRLELEKGKVSGIVLRTKGQKAPAPRAGDSAVTLWCGDVLTAGLNKMDEKSVEVESAVLGDLKISRDAVREIQFKK